MAEVPNGTVLGRTASTIRWQREREAREREQRLDDATLTREAEARLRDKQHNAEIERRMQEIERGAIRLENCLGHWGNVSVESVCKIALITRWLRPRRILEIGAIERDGDRRIQLRADLEDHSCARRDFLEHSLQRCGSNLGSNDSPFHAQRQRPRNLRWVGLGGSRGRPRSADLTVHDPRDEENAEGHRKE